MAPNSPSASFSASSGSGHNTSGVSGTLNGTGSHTVEAAISSNTSSSSTCSSTSCGSVSKQRYRQTEIEIPETINRKSSALSSSKFNDCIDGAFLYNGTTATAVCSDKVVPETNVRMNEDNNNYCHYHRSMSSNGGKSVVGSALSAAAGRLNQQIAMNNYLKTGFAMLYTILAMTSNLFVLAFVHERVPMNQKALPDLGFDLFPRVDWVLNISEYIIMGEVTLMFMVIMLHRYRQLLFRRMCLIIGTLYIFRGICMASTVFPVANDRYYCSPQMRNPNNPNDPIPLGRHISVVMQRVWHMLGGMGLSINGKHSYCGDYMYSGHTVMLSFCYLFIREYALPRRLRTFNTKLINVLLFCASCTGVICVIISRGHYLIDILVAYYVTTRLFWIYHTIAHNQMLMVNNSSNYLANVWWFPLFQYFEMNCNINALIGSSSNAGRTVAGDRLCACGPMIPPTKYCDCAVPAVPRKFEWPLPWPRYFRRRSTLLPCHQRLLPQQA